MTDHGELTRRVLPTGTGRSATWFAVAVLAALVAACTGASSTRVLPTSLHTESDDVVYGAAGTSAVTPIGRREVMTLGIDISNRSGTTVRITEVEVAESEGATATPALVVGPPRAVDLVHGAMGFPPEREWDRAVERPFAPFTLRPGEEQGTLVLLRVEVAKRFAYVKGVWVRGMQDGQPFEDFVDTFYGYCRDGSGRPTAACKEFANGHAFLPF